LPDVFHICKLELFLFKNKGTANFLLSKIFFKETSEYNVKKIKRYNEVGGNEQIFAVPVYEKKIYKPLN